jgi:hypothetical protein
VRGFGCEELALRIPSFPKESGHMTKTTMTMTKLALYLALSIPLVAGEVVQLHQNNFHEITTGKSVFIKFFAPWVRPKRNNNVLCIVECFSRELIRWHRLYDPVVKKLFTRCLYLPRFSVATVKLWRRIGKNWLRFGRIMRWA